MAEKLITSIKITAELEKKLHQNMVSERYGLRGKSRWVEEAILSFLEIPEYIDLVDIASEMTDFTITLNLRLNEETFDRIESAVLAVRKIFPTMDGVKSNIIRASIIQRIIRKSSVPEQGRN